MLGFRGHTHILSYCFQSRSCVLVWQVQRKASAAYWARISTPMSSIKQWDHRVSLGGWWWSWALSFQLTPLGTISIIGKIINMSGTRMSRFLDFGPVWSNFSLGLFKTAGFVKFRTRSCHFLYPLGNGCLWVLHGGNTQVAWEQKSALRWPSVSI